jgi:DNA recombination protein RmuC
VIFIVIALCLTLLFFIYRHQKLLSQKTFSQQQKEIEEMAEKLQAQMRLLENERKVDHGALQHQLQTLLQAEQQLKNETSKLAKALRSPAGRGRWGEMQLKRVLELAGMLSHCDFAQQSGEASDGRLLKPDLIVRLPGDRQVVIDAKVPLEAYLEGIEASDDEMALNKFRQHARRVKDHITLLGKKSYWEHFQPTPEFVVLFLPSDTIFSAAMEADPLLIEHGVSVGVMLATPGTLIAMLRAVAYGWKQESLSRHAKQINDLGRELYKRIFDLTGHWRELGKSLDQATAAYNLATGSLERNVLSTARKFNELGAASSIQPLKELDLVEREARDLKQESS